MDGYLTKKAAIKEALPTIFGYIGISVALELSVRQVAFLPSKYL